MSVCLWTKWCWVRVHFQSLKLQVSHLLWARSSLTFWQLYTLKPVCDMTTTYNCFSDVFTYCLNLKHIAFLFFLTKDNFMFWINSLFFSFNLSYYIKHDYSWKNFLTIIFEIMKKEKNANKSSFDTLIRC